MTPPPNTRSVPHQWDSTVKLDWFPGINTEKLQIPKKTRKGYDNSETTVEKL